MSSREAWTLRRNGRQYVGLVVTVEPSLLATAGLPTVRDGEGHLWYLVGGGRG